MVKNALLESVKNTEITRRITFAIKNENNDEQLNHIKSELCHSLHYINRQVSLSLGEIAKLSYTPTKVSLQASVPTIPFFERDIDEVFEQLNYPEDLRIILKFDEFDEKRLDTKIEESEISHLVEISVIDSKSNDIRTKYLKKIHSKDTHKIKRIIQDVMLDISMYHTFVSPILVDTPDNFKREFTYLKISLAEKNKLSSPIWLSQNYVSLAGYFYDNNNNLDIPKYIQAWNEIKDEVIKRNPEIVNLQSKGVIDQLKRHKYIGEISVKKVLKQAESLESGNYLLIRTTIKPKKKKKRKSILTYFKGTKWRKGKIHIHPEEMLEELSKYHPWITIFKLTL